MTRNHTGDITSTILLALLVVSFNAFARDIEPNANIGLRYTDNVLLTPDNEESELVLSASVGAAIDLVEGPFDISAATSFRHERYAEDTFGNQDYFSLSATARWEAIRDRMVWKFEDFFTQQSIDSLAPNTPDNTQDTNVVTIGPDITFPISGRQSLKINPEYRKFTYEVGDIDNDQQSVSVIWNYKLFRTLDIGIGGDVNEVDYENQALNDSKFTNISLTLNGQRSRLTYSASVGATHAETENISSTRGSSGSLAGTFNISSASRFRLNFSTSLTDTSSELLNVSQNPLIDAFNAQFSSQVLRNKIFRVSYSREKASLSTDLWAELSEQDYNLDPTLDREVKSAGIDLGYPLTAVVSLGLFSRYTNTELTQGAQEDELYSLGASLRYQMSRRMNALFELNTQSKDSTLANQVYDEHSVFVSVSYSGF